ncbi:hypothetical protein [[Haemophilus] ducreyi]|uniref:hypothetical protein n=1 Tax=Haemophilus ducreyi TaxID=730 RepID=UPI0006554779|nr:hypothetical protein [[Haemophilus] ducreyi]AKO45746.1 hypothetical protein RZ66_05890 [[Haemophilus] ducreyi]AKO47132.1 hypothetical protein RZ67_05810 [[Haemophilus] ducreyi]AKO48494.1 hypothetical protein RZ68_05885 [[Haemophilus] ducreyi]AKO49863.1 hypothetical protein RZ69_05830 [[Haemophilus] ducreyi]ANF62428.1 hypothetical protein A6037_06800 [[Haemophilus] ducreyi]
MENPFTAEWTRKQQVMCLGHWIIHYNGKLIDLPKERYDSNMGTKGIYNYIDPEDELYLDGLDEDEWIVENIEWLSDLFIAENIPIEEQTMRYFYQAVH